MWAVAGRCRLTILRLTQPLLFSYQELSPVSSANPFCLDFIDIVWGSQSLLLRAAVPIPLLSPIPWSSCWVWLTWKGLLCLQSDVFFFFSLEWFKHRSLGHTPHQNSRGTNSETYSCFTLMCAWLHFPTLPTALDGLGGWRVTVCFTEEVLWPHSCPFLVKHLGAFHVFSNSKQCSADHTCWPRVAAFAQIYSYLWIVWKHMEKNVSNQYCSNIDIYFILFLLC